MPWVWYAGGMQIPRYFFAHDFEAFGGYFLSQPHGRASFRKGEYLWAPGEALTRVHYIVSGIALTALDHENGFRKISSLHGAGTVFPGGAHRPVFKIEQAIATVALSDMETLSFSKAQYQAMARANGELAMATLDWYGTYINLLLYEGAHQDYNSSFIKLCNLLYLFSQNSPGGPGEPVPLTQEDMAEIMAVTRVNVARSLTRLRGEGVIKPRRGRVEITDHAALEAYCTQETLLGEGA